MTIEEMTIDSEGEVAEPREVKAQESTETESWLWFAKSQPGPGIREIE